MLHITTPKPHDDILKIIANIVRNWDTADKRSSDELKYSDFTAMGDIEPLRLLLILYGNPLKTKPKGTLHA